MRRSLIAMALTVVCAGNARAQTINASLGAYFEDNSRVGGVDLDRLPVTLTLSLGSPRHTQIDIEPSAGWHVTPTGTDASGFSWTRVRAWHLFGAAHRFSHGPDVEAYLKTESQQSLGFGYNRVMPGWQVAYRFHGELRATLRARYEFSGGEDPGVTALSRIVTRSTLYLPPAGRFSLWVRNDIAFDLHGAPNQYNVEANLSARAGPQRRLTAFVGPRIYVGRASRGTNQWRLRTGLTWQLGNLVMHRTHESDLRQPTFGDSFPSKP